MVKGLGILVRLLASVARPIESGIVLVCCSCCTSLLLLLLQWLLFKYYRFHLPLVVMKCWNVVSVCAPSSASSHSWMLLPQSNSLRYLPSVTVDCITFGVESHVIWVLSSAFSVLGKFCAPLLGGMSSSAFLYPNPLWSIPALHLQVVLGRDFLYHQQLGENTSI